MSMDVKFTGAPSSFYCVALNLALHELPAGEARDLVEHALDAPSPEAIRAVLKIGFGQPWCTRVHHALVEVGIAATGMLECRS